MAVGLDETLYVREGRYRRQVWSTQIVDVQRGQLLDVVAGRDVSGCCAWFASRSQAWLDGIRWINVGSVELVSHRVRHDAPDRSPGRRPVPCRQVREHRVGRVPTPGAERHRWSPRPQRRPLYRATPPRLNPRAPRCVMSAAAGSVPLGRAFRFIYEQPIAGPVRKKCVYSHHQEQEASGSYE